MADEHEARVRAALAQMGDEIGEVVLGLAFIGDIAARARGAVAADVGRDRRDARRRESRAERVHLQRHRRGAVHEDRHPVAGRGIESIGELAAVARLETGEVRSPVMADPARALGDRS